MLERLTGVYGLINQAMQGSIVGGVPQPSQPAWPENQAMPESALAPEPVPYELELDRIVEGKRIRQHSGDLEGLTESIRVRGVLTPLLVCRMKDGSSRFELVDGRRRLQVCRSLGFRRVPIRLVVLERLVDGEIDCTLLHKQFTVSERVNIGLMAEADLGERRGRPKENGNTAPHGPAMPPWKEAAFGNPETYRQAKSVVESGDAALIARMDSEEISINAAFVLLKPKTPGEQPKANGADKGVGEEPMPQAVVGNGEKPRPGDFLPSRTKPSVAAASKEELETGDAFKVRKFTQAMVDIQQSLQDHGAFALEPKVVDGALCLPAENTRLALIVAAFKVENLAQMIEEGKLTLKIAK